MISLPWTTSRPHPCLFVGYLTIKCLRTANTSNWHRPCWFQFQESHLSFLEVWFSLVINTAKRPCDSHNATCMCANISWSHKNRHSDVAFSRAETNYWTFSLGLVLLLLPLIFTAATKSSHVSRTGWDWWGIGRGRGREGGFKYRGLIIRPRGLLCLIFLKSCSRATSSFCHVSKTGEERGGGGGGGGRRRGKREWGEGWGRRRGRDSSAALWSHDHVVFCARCF